MTTEIKSDEVLNVVIDLQAFGDLLEAAGDRRWITVARAAAILEALRLGIATIPDAGLPPRWIGLDMAKPGKDTTVTYRGDCHA